jgi:thiamine biosynthesis lipoprotein
MGGQTSSTAVPSSAAPLSRRDLLTASLTSTPCPADYLIRVHRPIMACRFEVVLPGERADEVPAARAALDCADRLEALMSVFRESSGLSTINRSAARGPVPVHPDLVDVLLIAQHLHRESGGAFDVTSTPLSRCWGFLRRSGRLPADDEIDAARASVGMTDVLIDRDSKTVTFARDGIEVNLGAIGKGFALDRMGDVLRHAGVGAALLSAGRSSVLAIDGYRKRWKVEVCSTVQHERLAIIHLSSGALGTSGSGEQFVECNGVRYGHVIDPRTGWPASGVLSATVVCAHAAVADALSTAFLIGGVELARHYCGEHPDVLAIVTPDEHPRRPVVIGSYSDAVVELS